MAPPVTGDRTIRSAMASLPTCPPVVAWSDSGDTGDGMPDSQWTILVTLFVLSRLLRQPQPEPESLVISGRDGSQRSDLITRFVMHYGIDTTYISRYVANYVIVFWSKNNGPP